MKIISFIEEKEVIEKILRHLGLWETCLRATHRQARNHDPPVRNSFHIPEFAYDDAFSQIAPFDYWLQ